MSISLGPSAGPCTLFAELSIAGFDTTHQKTQSKKSMIPHNTFFLFFLSLFFFFFTVEE